MFFFDLKINLAKISSMIDVDLSFEEDFILVNTKNQTYSELKIPLKSLKEKYEIKHEEIEAKFVKKTSILKIKVPLVVKS